MTQDIFDIFLIIIIFSQRLTKTISRGAKLCLSWNSLGRIHFIPWRHNKSLQRHGWGWVYYMMRLKRKQNMGMSLFVQTQNPFFFVFWNWPYSIKGLTYNQKAAVTEFGTFWSSLQTLFLKVWVIHQKSTPLKFPGASLPVSTSLPN